MNSYLAQLGGRQITANAIDLDGTGIVVVPVPGESKVRNLAGSTAASLETTGTCFEGDFCVWQLNNRNGAFIAKFKCNSAVNFPRSNPDWLAKVGGVFQGSYWNHQTGGAHAFIYSGVNATGNLNFSPPVGSPTNRPWGAPLMTSRSSPATETGRATTGRSGAGWGAGAAAGQAHLAWARVGLAVVVPG